jgi:hypothetical protein
MGAAKRQLAKHNSFDSTSAAGAKPGIPGKARLPMSELKES